MSKSKKRKTSHNKGRIKDNALKALVRSNVFLPKIEKDKKKYSRKTKHKGSGR